MALVLDVGMYDGADTAYYLSMGFRVVAVEANPALVAQASERFAKQIRDGRLTILHAAVAPTTEPVTLTLNGAALCASSTSGDIAHPAGSYVVDGLTMAAVLNAAGERPYFIKIDIEGADRLCVEGLTPETRPDFLSIEIHDGPDPTLPTLRRLGYSRFKIIDQRSFREISRRRLLGDRIRRRVMHHMGLAEPTLFNRSGKWFRLQSSGPAPWESDGDWHTSEHVSRQFHEHREALRETWCDLHAH
jgi:FkbM family methyltransferase